MANPTVETLESYEIRINALEIIREAYLAKIEALELLNKQLQYLRNDKIPAGEPLYSPGSVTSLASIIRKKPGRPRKNPQEAEIGTVPQRREEKQRKALKKQKANLALSSNKLNINKELDKSVMPLEVPLQAELKKILKEGHFNNVTFRAITGILLYLFDKGMAKVPDLVENLGGTRVSIVRQTTLLKKMKLLTYIGSRKTGHYILTTQGRGLYMSLMKSK